MRSGTFGSLAVLVMLLGVVRADDKKSDSASSAKTSGEKTPRVKFEVRAAEDATADGLTEAVEPLSGKKIYLHKDVAFANADIAEARAVKRKNDGSIEERPEKFQIELTLTKDAGEKSKQFTEARINKQIAIMLDGKLVSAPFVKSAISAKWLLPGPYSKEEAEKIAEGITAK
jgi:preprotein translocase subunit SecD